MTKTPTKYQLNDNVVIVSRNIPGVVIGIDAMCDIHGYRESYEVSYEHDFWDPSLSVAENKPVRKTKKFAEEDLRLSVHAIHRVTPAETMCQAYERMLEIWESQFINTALGDSLDRLSASITSCAHDWKSYEGLTQKYDYCTRCDIKRQ
jgi:hypothetical protein